jgi:hypothetical protein
MKILRGDDVWLALEEHQNLRRKGSVCSLVEVKINVDF